MSARSLLLALAVGGVVATSSCSTVVPDSGPGPTLPPLPTSSVDSVAVAPDEVADAAPQSDVSVQSTMVTTVLSTTSTTTPETSTTSSTSTTSTTATSTTAVSTSPAEEALIDGVRATIGGRTLQFAASCRDGDALTLDGITWAFAGNSFRFSGADDERSEAELIGDGWTMPMLVASVRSGVYTYVGTPVAGSVRSAEVAVDFGAVRDC